ncbi:hypothetical protein EV426DRAFT_712908 [Tirmania nivea]|nr:hypothetical protein EV426DRAFT_712908 [Tirmania nivea]
MVLTPNPFATHKDLSIEEDEEERRWITLGEALAEAITDTLDIEDSEIDAGSSSEELSETTSTSETSSSAPPSWVEDEDNWRSLPVVISALDRAL